MENLNTSKRFLNSVLCWNVLNVRKMKECGSNLHYNESSAQGLRRMFMVRRYQWHTRATVSLINETHYFHCRPAYILLIKRSICNKQREEERAGERLCWKVTDSKDWRTRLWILIRHVTDLHEYKLLPSIMSKTRCFFPSCSPWTPKLGFSKT